MEPSTDSTPYHEAAHAITALVFGLAVGHLSIEPDAIAPNSMGAAIIQDPFVGVGPAVGVSRSERSLWAQIYALVLCAGNRAELRFDPSAPIGSSIPDLRRAHRVLAQYSAAAPDRVGAILEKCKLAADRVLDQEWAAVEAVASALLSFNSLDGSQVRAIARRTMSRSLPYAGNP